MGEKRAKNLIKKYLEGIASQEEEALLESWYNTSAQDRPTAPGNPDFVQLEADLTRLEAEIWQPLLAEQEGRPLPLNLTPRLAPRLWPRIVAATATAAAAVIITIGITRLFIPGKTLPPRLTPEQNIENDILPATIGATLTLMDNKTITVDSTTSPLLARQAGQSLSSADGRLIYRVDQPHTTQNTIYNTLTTHPGQHYSLALPDGTIAWLNAGSSITYPVIFESNERRVRITGEVYFEIVHNAQQPFRITAGDQLVEDIGTHLNINAYKDETNITTTLLEGSVKLTLGSATAILKPGEAAETRHDDQKFNLHQVDAAKAIAWKEGYFYFDRADIHAVMRQLARWYNVQVVYKGSIPKRTFKGKVYRNIKASEALRILSYFGASSTIDGNTITVSS
jgi:ferric-dicitrate binding protein FerR (iron transport regulator)